MMKHLILSLFVLTGLTSVTADEQQSPERWEKSIAELETRLRASEPKPGAVLFIGSSSIRLWKLDESFPDVRTVNHGFGGSHLSDSVHFFDRLVTPVHPSRIVIYAGDNDMAAGKSPETICQDFQQFVAKVREHVPECRQVIYIGIKPSVQRWALEGTARRTNELIRDVCETDPERLQIVDLWHSMLGADGKPRPDLLLEDGLHLNSGGYRIWTEAVKPFVTDADAATGAR